MKDSYLVKNKYLGDMFRFTGNASPIIVFNVPKDSKIVINIVGSGTVEFGEIGLWDTRSGVGWFNCIFFPVDDEIYTEDELSNNTLAYVYDGNNLLRDEDGTPIAFMSACDTSKKTVYGTDSVMEAASRILYNVPQATSIKLSGNIGSILAPNANVSGFVAYYGTYYHGYYMAGTLICNSYTGCTQFGYSAYTRKNTN